MRGRIPFSIARTLILRMTMKRSLAGGEPEMEGDSRSHQGPPEALALSEAAEMFPQRTFAKRAPRPVMMTERKRTTKRMSRPQRRQPSPPAQRSLPSLQSCKSLHLRKRRLRAVRTRATTMSFSMKMGRVRTRMTMKTRTMTRMTMTMMMVTKIAEMRGRKGKTRMAR